MSIIPKQNYSEQTSILSVANFLKQYKLGSILRCNGAYKLRGIPVVALVNYLVALIYTGKSMFEDMRSANPLARGFGKDAVYRFMSRASINWRGILLSLAHQVIDNIDKLTSDNRQSAFVIDDTLYHVPYARKTELVSRVFDHSGNDANKFKWGFRLLTLCWTDGVSLIPLAFRHMASAKEQNQRCGMHTSLDKRSRAYRNRSEALSKATDVVIVLLKSAICAGTSARHVLFDTWFAYPATIIKIRSLRLHVTARVKDTTKIKYVLGDEAKTAREIYKANRKRRGRSRYLLSVPVILLNEKSQVNAKLVYVRNRNKRKDWIAIVTTDLSLTEEEVIALYGKRWDIEVFFKICKSYLKLSDEFHQLSYDALTAHTTIVMIRYIILSLEKRKQEDPRSIGELYYNIFDEMADIRYEHAIMLLLELLKKILSNDLLGLPEEQVEQIMDRFLQNLPPFLRKSLCRSSDAV